MVLAILAQLHQWKLTNSFKKLPNTTSKKAKDLYNFAKLVKFRLILSHWALAPLAFSEASSPVQI